jgi:hypothetical protein
MTMMRCVQNVWVALSLASLRFFMTILDRIQLLLLLNLLIAGVWRDVGNPSFATAALLRAATSEEILRLQQDAGAFRARLDLSKAAPIWDEAKQVLYSTNIII